MKGRYRWLDLAVVVGLILVGGATFALPALLASHRASNERYASMAICTITKAQADFQSNDRDGNGVADFWTADVYALHGLIAATSSSLPADSTDATKSIRLIDESLAAADGLTQQAGYGNVTFSSAIGYGRMDHGYFFRALHNWEQWRKSRGTMLNDTDGSHRMYGPVHDTGRFGIVAFPKSLSHGKSSFFIGEDGQFWKYSLPTDFTATFSGARGAARDSTSSTSGPNLAFELTLKGTPGQGTFPDHPGRTGASKAGN